MSTKDDKKTDSLAYETYVRHREAIVQGLYEQAKGFDKAILTLGSGALALSLSFVRYVAPSPKPWSLWALGVAWACFAVSLVCTLVSFLASLASHRAALDQWDAHNAAYAENQSDGDGNQDAGQSGRPCAELPSPKYAELTSRLNIAAGVLFIFGVIALVVFCLWNTPESAPKAREIGNEQEARKTEQTTNPQTCTEASTTCPPRSSAAPTGSKAPQASKETQIEASGEGPGAVRA